MVSLGLLGFALVGNAPVILPAPRSCHLVGDARRPFTVRAEHSAFDEMVAAASLPTGDDARLRISIRKDLAPEEYRLKLGSVTRLEAGSATGVAWGLQSLSQLARTGGGVREIRDRPAFGFRCLMVDTARHYHSISTLRRLIRWCQVGRVRYLQLHLTDDQNWMFPSVVMAGAERNNANRQPPYSREELRDLQRFARVRGVTLIPEIDMPGHSSLLVKLDPSTYRIRGSDSWNCVNFASPIVKRRLKTVLREVAELFPDAPYIHLGGDEASYSGAAGDPEFAREMRRLGPGADPEDVFVEFVSEMAREVMRLGKVPIVWEGFRPSARARRVFPKEGMVVAWENAYYPAAQLARDGFKVINAGWDPLYVVNHYRSNSFTMVPESRLYAWNPTAFGHVMEPANSVNLGPATQGAMMCWWEGTEWNAQRVLPLRILALGARLWNPSGETDFAAFHARAKRELARVDAEDFRTLRAGAGSPTVGRPLGDPQEFRTLTVPGSETFFERTDSAERVPNLALDCPVTSDGPGDLEFPPSALTDGDARRSDSFWLTYPTPQTATIDLGRAAEVSRIEVFPFSRTGERTLYILEVRAGEGSRWERVGDFSQAPRVPTAAGNTHSFTRRPVRYVRIRVTGSDQFPPSLGRIHEVRVFP